MNHPALMILVALMLLFSGFGALLGLRIVLNPLARRAWHARDYALWAQCIAFSILMLGAMHWLMGAE